MNAEGSKSELGRANMLVAQLTIRAICDKIVIEPVDRHSRNSENRAQSGAEEDER
jgi:hypothetical protein